jgi:hypothetical protein
MTKSLLFAAGMLLSLSVAGVHADDKVDFAKQIRPVFAENCYKCHAGAKHKGNFKLDSVEAIQKGGKEGSDIVPGNPAKSDVYHRITLPPDDDDVMPPSDKGKPLSKDQTSLIKKWIEEGANFGDWKKDEAKEGAASADAPGKAGGAAAADDGSAPVPAIPQVAAASPAALDQLRTIGAQCLPLCQGSNLLAVEFTSSAPQISDQQVAMLAQVAPQVYDLNLANTKVTDEGLHRLHLEKTAIDDAGLAHLKSLASLQYLNLYHTGISDAGLDELKDLKNLKNLYVWQSKVTDGGAEELKKADPSLNIDTGWKETAKADAPKEAGK